MRLKKVVKIVLLCAIVIGCLCVTASAQDIQSEQFLELENMEHEKINISSWDFLERSIGLRSSNSINTSVAAYSHAVSDEKFFLAERGIITINCSYSPSSASMDFGVIAPDGYFYFLNVEGGSINRSIRVNQRGDYLMAIRNNFSQVVSVVGFVTY